MKIISVILIIAYLMLPVLCFGHPCDFSSADAQHGTASAASAGCPLHHDTDDCETTCCCAGYEMTPIFVTPLNAPRISILLAYLPDLFLPQVIAKIFVPPQNLS